MSIAIRLEEDMAVIEISRTALFEWLTGETKRMGYKTADGTIKDLPNDAGSGPNVDGSEPEPGSESTGEPQAGGADMFEERGGKGGKITNPQAKELTAWLKENKLEKKNYCWNWKNYCYWNWKNYCYCCWNY